MSEIPTRIQLNEEQLTVYESCLTILSEIEDTILLALGMGVPGVTFTKEDALYMVAKSLEAITTARGMPPEELDKLVEEQFIEVQDNVISFEDKQKAHKDKGLLN